MALRVRASATLAGLAGCLAIHSVAAQGGGCAATDSVPANVVRLRFDHKSGQLAPVAHGDSLLVLSVKDHVVHLRRGAQVQLCVTSTNTAWYNVTVDTSQAPPQPGNPKSSGDASAFFNAVHGPFSMLMGGLTRGEASMLPPVPAGRPDFPAPLAEARTTATAMERDITVVQSLSVGPGSIPSVRDAERAALRRMQDSTPERAAAEFRVALRREFPPDSLHLTDQPCQPTDGRALALSNRLEAHLRTLRAGGDSLTRQLALANPVPDDFRYFRDTLAWFKAHADSFLAATTQYTDSAAAAERLMTYISGACSYKASARRPVSAAAAQRFIVQITPWPEPDIVRVASDTVRPTAITVYPPRPFVLPSYGVSLLAAPSAQFPVYATRTDTTTGAKGLQIYQSSTTDVRYSWGGTVGLSWRWLDWTESTHLALWIPEVSVEQLSNTTGFGVGSAISWRSVKIGAGLLWIQHSELVGHTPGDHVPNAGYFQTTNSYGKPNWYLSFSIFGAPGFGGK